MMWDVGELAAIAPADVVGYLAATGWQHTGDYGRTRIWSRSVDADSLDTDSVEVLLPESNQLRDYPARMVELLGTLAEVEGRTPEDVLRELRDPLVDVQYIRTMPDTPSGTTPLLEGVKALQGVRELFLAAATSAVLGGGQAVLPPGQRPPKAREFVDQVRLGVPSAGSYVLRVETPLGTGAPTLDGIGPRTMLLHLYRAVRAAHTAAVESAGVGIPRPFERQVEHGVSANLCQALADIGGGRRSPFEFRFAWARTVPAAEATPDLHFRTEHVVALHDAAKHLRDLAGAVPATVLGRPIDLKRRDNEPTGRVVVEGRVELAGRTEENRQVVMRLPRDLYDAVVQAHRPEQPASVEVTGLLRTSGQRWEFVGVEGLRIVR